MQEIIRNAMHRQRIELAELLSASFGELAAQCAAVWGQREVLNCVLSTSFDRVPYSLFLYVVDIRGRQVCDNIGANGAVVAGHYGRDRSQRPYMQEEVPAWGFLLSSAYLSLRANRPSLTALQIIRVGANTVGYLGADFDLRDLPATAAIYEESSDWRQVKGDPAIRSTVFQQCRVESVMDRNMATICVVLEELMCERGMFQGVIHFSSSQAIIWLMSDPYRYRILDHEALSDPDVCLLYPHQTYPGNALIPQSQISKILTGLSQLRSADETLYLRQASINLFNGMISLTFSCDGTHYMSWQEFLVKDLTFWLGSAN